MDERTLELIHGEIDGELGPDEQRELEACLQATPGARQEYDRLRALEALLGGLAEADPPAGLRDSILAAAHRPATAIRIAPVRRRRWGMAAALAATVVGVTLFLGRGPEVPELDPSVLRGTMGRPAAQSGVPSWRLDAQVVSGSILLHNSTDGLALEVDLVAERPVEVVLTAEGSRLELAGFVRLPGMPTNILAADGQVRLLHRGSQHYALVLTNKGAVASAIDVSVYDGDELIGEGRLAVPAGMGPTGD